MKMSVVLGVAQMTLGILMSLVNFLYWKQYARIVCEFIPQILFLHSVFGYMCFLIFLKWTTIWEDASRAPRILNLLTEMILSPWSLSEQFTMFYGQHFVQFFLILIAAICVPWMLLSGPLLELYRRRKSHTVMNDSDVSIPMSTMDADGKEVYMEEDYYHEESDGGHGGDHDISEVFIHQGIHTIEFVLGCISNTASYLRLWALSLAHSELSAVFWERVLMAGLHTANPFLIFCAWSVWAVLTVGVLLGMESLSAFLHALRLHWYVIFVLSPFFLDYSI